MLKPRSPFFQNLKSPKKSGCFDTSGSQVALFFAHIPTSGGLERTAELSILRVKWTYQLQCLDIVSGLKSECGSSGPLPHRKGMQIGVVLIRLSPRVELGSPVCARTPVPQGQLVLRNTKALLFVPFLRLLKEHTYINNRNFSHIFSIREGFA